MSSTSAGRFSAGQPATRLPITCSCWRRTAVVGPLQVLEPPRVIAGQEGLGRRRVEHAAVKRPHPQRLARRRPA